MIARNWKGWFHAEGLNVPGNSSSGSDIVTAGAIYTIYVGLFPNKAHN